MAEAMEAIEAMASAVPQVVYRPLTDGMFLLAVAVLQLTRQCRRSASRTPWGAVHARSASV